MRAATLFLISATAVAATAAAAETGRLRATASAAMAAISPLAQGTNYVTLPALEFALSIEPSCPAEYTVESVSVSIADTRASLDGEGIDGVIETTLQLPRKQTVHVRIENFCQAGESQDAASRLRLNDVLTARLSLRCSNGDRQSIVYQTLPLAVELDCAREAAEMDEIQEASAESAASF